MADEIKLTARKHAFDCDIIELIDKERKIVWASMHSDLFHGVEFAEELYDGEEVEIIIKRSSK